MAGHCDCRRARGGLGRDKACATARRNLNTSSYLLARSLSAGRAATILAFPNRLVSTMSLQWLIGRVRNPVLPTDQ
jgi:hypothetical protein